MDEKIFVEGFYSNEVPDTLPEYILGKGSLHVEKLTKFLADNKSYADSKGYLNYTILRSKEAGNRYIVLDLWKWKKEQEEKQTTFAPVIANDESGQRVDTGDIRVEDIPF